MKSNSIVRWLHKRLITLAMLAAVVWTLFPFYMAFVLSIKHQGDFFRPRYIPFLQFQPTWNNWRYEWRTFADPSSLGQGLVNSLVVAGCASALCLILGLAAAYGMRRMHHNHLPVWPLMVLFLLPRLLPPVVCFLPFTMMMRWAGLTDTRLALIFAHTTLALPLAVIILYTVMGELPDDLLDAAQVDGCGPAQELGLVLVPLLLPAMLAAGGLCFAASWNEFLYALANAQQHTWTAPLSIASLITKDGIEFEYVGTHLLLVMLPPILLALAARRYLVRGLSLGTVKETDST